MKIIHTPLSQAHALFTRDFQIILNSPCLQIIMGGKRLEIGIKPFGFCSETFFYIGIFMDAVI